MNTHTTDDAIDSFIPVASAAKQLGFMNSQHFRISVAPKLNIPVLKICGRWKVSHKSLASALVNIVRKEQT